MIPLAKSLGLPFKSVTHKNNSIRNFGPSSGVRSQSPIILAIFMKEFVPVSHFPNFIAICCMVSPQGGTENFAKTHLPRNCLSQQITKLKNEPFMELPKSIENFVRTAQGIHPLWGVYIPKFRTIHTPHPCTDNGEIWRGVNPRSTYPRQFSPSSVLSVTPVGRIIRKPADFRAI